MYLLLIVLGFVARFFTKWIATKDFMDSFTYSPMDQWEGVLEGIFLHNEGFSVYDNDVVHQSPLALRFWNLLNSLPVPITAYFVIFELMVLASIPVLCKSLLSYHVKLQKERKETYHSSTIPGHLINEDLHQISTFVLLVYCLNPYSIVSFAAQSTSIVNNLFIIWILIACCKGCSSMASILCAVACYHQFYPITFVLSVLAVPFMTYSTDRNWIRCLLASVKSFVCFAFTLGMLLWISYRLEGNSWAFVNSVYLDQLSITDSTPQPGIYWYMVVEMFDHFHQFFLWIFQLTIFATVFLLSIRFSYDPAYLLLVIAFTVNLLQPYHCVGQLGLLISLLPNWWHLLRHARIPLVTICTLSSACVLIPLFHYIWLQSGTANSNFFFAVCLVHAVGQALLVSDLFVAFVKREFELRVGTNCELSDGSKLVRSTT